MKICKNLYFKCSTVFCIRPRFIIEYHVVLHQKKLELLGCYAARQVIIVYSFNCQPHKIVKHTQTLRQQQPTCCLTIFGG